MARGRGGRIDPGLDSVPSSRTYPSPLERARENVRGSGVAILLLALLSLLAGFAAAQPTDVTFETGEDPTSRLEIRTLTLPDGTEVEFFVLTGNPAVVTIGSDTLTGDRIELDLGNEVVRIVGDGTFTSGDETIVGRDLVVRIDEETLQGRSVVIATDAIDVRGDRASRVPGRIQVTSGAFSPCSRCDQEVEDFGFRAQRLELFPGDRLVAYDVTILIRGAPIATLPIFVVPLGPVDRQPALSVTRGSASRRARIVVAWPYVAGGSALGTLRVRYEADIDPLAGDFVTNRLLGGAVIRSYVAADIDHRFFTDRGAGTLRVGYEPGFVVDEEKREPSVLFGVDYRTDAGAGDPQIAVRVVRDDAVRRDLVEYRLETSAADAGIRGTFLVEDFADLDLDDAIDRPSYDSARRPLRTRLQFRVEADESDLAFGPLALDEAAADIGVFEDQSNPINRSAASRPTVLGVRLRVEHRETLLQPLWDGASIDGLNVFQGDYYDTTERQVVWSSLLGVEQRFGRQGRLRFEYYRDTQEGETPFRFDSVTLRGSSGVRGDFSVTATPWLRATVRGGYVFTDTRRPDAEGFETLDSRLDLFASVRWLDLSLSNSWDIEARDPGELVGRLQLRVPSSAVRAAVDVEHAQDLDPTLPRRGRPGIDPGAGEVADTSRSRVRAELGYTDVVVASAEGGYRWAPDTPGEPWDDLDADLTFGSLRTGDPIPGLRFGGTRDLNRGEWVAVEGELEIPLGPLGLTALQRIDVRDGRVERSRARLVWPGIAALESDGLPFVDPSWLGIAVEPRLETYTLSLRDDADAGLAWSVTYEVDHEPVYDEFDAFTGYAYRNPTLEGRVEYAQARVGGVRLDFASRALIDIADDQSPYTYLRDLDLLRIGIDAYGVVGLQGDVTYRSQYSSSADAFSLRRLAVDDVTLTARVVDSLLVGATFDEVWDLTGASSSPFNVQPTVFFVLDRCCWALYGSWDTATGNVTLTLTTPGSETGLGDVFGTPFVLPGRD